MGGAAGNRARGARWRMPGGRAGWRLAVDVGAGWDSNRLNKHTMKKFLRIFVAVVIVGLVLFFLFRYYFVFGEGVKAGTLNYVVKKGFIFKTYEGKLIQTGLKSLAPNSMQSNEFTFSIADEAVALRLMVNSGREVELHYKEYMGSVPWRGYSEFIVDSVVQISEPGK
jgi:hypothetical protein